MPRLRIRDNKNSKWIDICQSEWRIRNAADTEWVRITPVQGLKVRHGTNNYWLNIDCLSDDDCGDDPYGGTEDGKGANGTGPGDNTTPDVGYPGETDGGGNSNFNPWDPSTGNPTTPTEPNDGNNSPGNPSYTDEDANNSEDGAGDTDCAQGTYTPGSYPPGYDLPDGCGPNAGVVTDENGETGIYRPGTDVIEPIDEENGDSTSEGDGTNENPYACPATINGATKKITEFSVALGSTPGQVDFEYDMYQGASAVVVYYAGVKVAGTDGSTTGTGRLSFQYAPVAGGDDFVFVRVRTAGATGGWTIKVPCPGEEQIGSITEPASCLGTFEPAGGGGKYTEVVHAIGTNPGTVQIDYNMFSIKDSLKVYYANVLLAETNGFVGGEGTLTFNFNPANGNDKITVRVESESSATAWKYSISCPGADGTSLNPKPCDNNNAVQSGGAGVTDLFFDLGPTAGVAQVRYQAWLVPDTFDVYQDNTLLASTGSVTGEGYLPFAYDPTKGDVHVKITGTGDTTWAFIMECPADPTVTMACGQTHVSTTAGTTVVTFTGANNAYSLVEYATVQTGNSPPSGAPDDVIVDYDGATVESTGAVLRWVDHGFGTLVIPTKAGVDSATVKTTSPVSWWQHTTYCPEPYPGTFGMSKFTTGMPHVYETGAYEPSVNPAAKQIAVTQNFVGKGKGCQILMTMFHTDGGAVTFRGLADDFAAIYVFNSANPTPLKIGDLLFSNGVTSHTATLAAGNYFLVVLLEETNVSSDTPSTLAMEVFTASRKCAVTSKDWYGDYFEFNKTYNGGNLPVIEQKNAAIFETEAEATAFMSANLPPSIENIFNTWNRYDGTFFFTSKADAEAQGTSYNATQWSYNPANGGSFEQAQNVPAPNAIISPSPYANYVFEATISSSDGDNDANGLVAAFARTSSGGGSQINNSLVIARTASGVEPTSGYGVLLVSGTSVTNVMPLTQGSAPSAWSNRFTKIRIVRTGNIIKFQASDFNSTVLGTEHTIDLMSDSRFAPFRNAAALGFYTHSQANSKFYDVVAPGLAGESVFSIQNNKIWDPVGASWNLVGSNQSFSSKLGAYKYVTNVATGVKFHIYNWVQRKA